MTINKPAKEEPTSKIAVETVSPALTSDVSSSTKISKSEKVENKGIFSKIKSLFRMS
ncbi:MAG: hypothetical protein ACW99A_08205 [Candidatus Kariarchaeaceae archaeon]|jgi:hypothetical protein